MMGSRDASSVRALAIELTSLDAQVFYNTLKPSQNFHCSDQNFVFWGQCNETFTREIIQIYRCFAKLPF